MDPDHGPWSDLWAVGHVVGLPLAKNFWAFLGRAEGGYPRTTNMDRVSPTVRGWCMSVAPTSSETYILIVLAYKMLQYPPTIIFPWSNTYNRSFARLAARSSL